MEMIRSRNQTSHTYNEEIAAEITEKVTLEYYPEFVSLEKKMSEFE